MPYPIPPWLSRDTDPAGKYMQGLHLGAQIQAEHERLQAQSQQTALELQLKTEQQNRDFLYRQQQDVIDHQMKEQELGLRRQQLQDQKLKIDIETRRAAQEADALMRFQQARAKLDPNAPDYITNINKLTLQMYPELFSTPAGLGGAMRAANPQAKLPPKLIRQQIEGKSYDAWYNPNTGQTYPIHEGQAAWGQRQMNQQRLVTLRAAQKRLFEDYDPESMAGQFLRKNHPEKADEIKRKLDNIQKEIDKLTLQEQGAASAPDQTALPAQYNYTGSPNLEENVDEYEDLGLPP